MNYAIRDKEISLQRDEIHFNRNNAEAEFRCQEGLKKLEIEFKQAEENAYSKQIEVLQLQVQLAKLQATNSLARLQVPHRPLSWNIYLSHFIVLSSHRLHFHCCIFVCYMVCHTCFFSHVDVSGFCIEYKHFDYSLLTV